MRTNTLLTATVIVLAFITVSVEKIRAEEPFVTVDRFVPHISSVSANQGERVGIFVREKITSRLSTRFARGGHADEGKVVLFVHGGSVPSVPDYDLPYKDYSWMSYLARAGYDTFAMDHSGYGLSPRPMMDDPCNMDTENRALVTPVPLSTDCQPKYSRGLTTSQSDWDEILTVVEFIRALRGVETVSLVGWSAGGPRTAGFAARYPEKIDKLVLFAPGYRRDQPSNPPSHPRGDVPMRIQTKSALEEGRWRSTVACENQIDPGIQTAIWQSIMAFDQRGAVWGAGHGVMRVRTSAGSWGWNLEYAAKVTAPTLIMVGEQDFLLESDKQLFEDLTSAESKVLVTMECATHFAVWESTQYKFMHEASLEWLESTTLRGETSGRFSVGPIESDIVRQ